ncbi:MAG: DUF4870 domain-containing protein [Flavobacterium sp.]|uniref:DUF4870 domain-containing protein n=1 Tax=Flavobacterium sp. TaxID=239 RepID=UPI001213D7A0|nr:DUF4870 domain-containing protein [Flavobacterium sp.]RZJ67031.1 MAG: DUF4870 domain-containing protein [Flavobacterium sp.]
METTSTKSKAMLAHLSTLTQWFFPFGNFIFPLVIWSTTRKDSSFTDHHGRQAINFQLSIFLYTLVLCLIAIPILVFTIFKHVPFREMADGHVYNPDLTPENVTGIVILAIIAVILFCFLKVAEFFLVINASVKAIDGIAYEYPLCIPFIGKPKELKTESVKEDINQSPEFQSSINSINNE